VIETFLVGLLRWHQSEIVVATNDYFVFVGQLFEHFSESLELLGFGPVCDVSSMDEEVSSREIFQLQFLESVVGV